MTTTVKISELPATTTVDDSDLIPIVQGTTTYRIRRDHFLGPVQVQMLSPRGQTSTFATDADDILRTQVFGG